MDVLVSAFGLYLTFPLCVLIALAVWIEDRHSPFFPQDRYGENETVFTLWKFRTMHPIYKGEVRKVEDMISDGRVTKVGRILRKTSLDSLPELYNVLSGEMSLVGPRPMPLSCEDARDYPYTSNRQIPYWRERTEVKPGMAGLAQVYCPKHTTRRNKFRFDALYARKQSIGLDFKILTLAFQRAFVGGWK